jgi:hypothetical protein
MRGWLQGGGGGTGGVAGGVTAGGVVGVQGGPWPGKSVRPLQGGGVWPKGGRKNLRGTQPAIE